MLLLLFLSCVGVGVLVLELVPALDILGLCVLELELPILEIEFEGVTDGEIEGVTDGEIEGVTDGEIEGVTDFVGVEEANSIP